MTAGPDIAHARAFLNRFDPEAGAFTLQTFDDTPEKRWRAARVWPQIDPANGALDVLGRWNKYGAGVFFTPNETDGTGRQAHNIKRVRAVFVDLDGAPLAPVLSAGLEPHIVVESSPGRYHAYWLCDDCPLDQFERVQRALAARFTGDPSVHDLPRVMRLPGFVHNKGEPFLTHVIEGVGFAGPPYALAEIVGTLGLDLSQPLARERLSSAEPGTKITAGGRHDHLFARGRSMAKGGMTREAVQVALDAENRTHCDPPLPEREIAYLAERAFTAKDAAAWSAIKSAPGDPTAPDVLEAQPAAASAPARDSDGAWPDPEPLTVGDDAQPYPLDALPAGIREAVAEVVGFVQCPPALAACSALSALSLAGQGLADVQRAPLLDGPVSLYLLAVADSGERKTTCDGYFLRPIREWEAEQVERYRPEVAAHAAARAAWDERCAGLRVRVRKASADGKDSAADEARLADEVRNEPAPLRVPALIHGDATPEALAWVLAVRWPSGGVMSSEAGIVFGGHGMGRDSVMRNLSLLNALWDGTRHRVERRTSESFTVSGARLTMGLAAQPETVRQFMEGTKGLARGNGFAARFLIAAPDSTQGTRLFKDAPAWAHLPAFAARLRAMLALPSIVNEGGGLELPMLTLTADAHALWRRFHDDVEAELRPGGEMADARDVASKAADNVARMAALFHLYAHGPAGQVGADCVGAAARIVHWHLFQARAFLGEVAAPRERSSARKLDAWLLDTCRQSGTQEVDRRAVQRTGPNATRGAAELGAALAELAEAGRIREVTEGRRKLVRVNPALLAGP